MIYRVLFSKQTIYLNGVIIMQNNITLKLVGALTLILSTGNAFGAAVIPAAAALGTGIAGSLIANRLDAQLLQRQPTPAMQPLVPAEIVVQPPVNVREVGLATVGTGAGLQATRAILAEKPAEAMALAGVSIGAFDAIDNPERGAVVAGASIAGYAALKNRKVIKDNCVMACLL